MPSGTGGYDGDRYYTPGGLLEVGGYLANTAHKIGEWASVGGTITLSAPEVVAQKGSVFDISGGSVRYNAGYITTTNFLGSDGRLYNINNARADMTFVGLGEGFVIKNERWGITAVWTSPFNRGRTSTRWEDGYTVAAMPDNSISRRRHRSSRATSLPMSCRAIARSMRVRPISPMATSPRRMSRRYRGTLALGRWR